jgi:hypothetical protein
MLPALFVLCLVVGLIVVWRGSTQHAA